MNYFSPEELKGLTVLSVWQPWPWCIFEPPPAERKDIENRTWQPDEGRFGLRLEPGQLLALHAGKTAHEFIATKDHVRQKFGLVVPDFYTLPRGAIVGVVRYIGFSWKSASRWAQRGQCHWELAEARPLQTPVVERGKQGLWIYQAQPGPNEEGEL